MEKRGFSGIPQRGPVGAFPLHPSFVSLLASFGLVLYFPLSWTLRLFFCLIDFVVIVKFQSTISPTWWLDSLKKRQDSTSSAACSPTMTLLLSSHFTNTRDTPKHQEPLHHRHVFECTAPAVRALPVSRHDAIYLTIYPPSRSKSPRSPVAGSMYAVDHPCSTASREHPYTRHHGPATRPS